MRGWVTGGNRAGTNLTNGTEEAKLNMMHIKQGAVKINQETLRELNQNHRDKCNNQKTHKCKKTKLGNIIHSRNTTIMINQDSKVHKHKTLS